MNAPVTPEALDTEETGLGFDRLNYILFAVALAVIIVGWLFLGSGSITLAPVLLVLGYCVLVPAALLVGMGKG